MNKLILSLIIFEGYACAGCYEMAQWFVKHFERKCNYQYSTDRTINFTCGSYGSASFFKEENIVHLQVYGKISPVYYLRDNETDWECFVREYDEYGMELDKITFSNDGTKSIDVYKSFKSISLQ